MQIGLITDTHYGVRNDSPVFYDYQKKSNDLFFNELIKRKITHIIHLGDLYDRKKYINYVTAGRARYDFLDRANQFHTDIIAGNHDIYHKNTTEVNALNELVRNWYPNIQVHMEPIQKNYGGLDIQLLPWIADNNYTISMDAIKTSTAPILFGHLQLIGFEMYKGQPKCDHGQDHKMLDRFDLVASGHFHHKSTTGSINYLGAAYEFTWADYNDPRGFHIFDTETRSLEFIQNPHKMFYMELYDDSDANIKSLNEDIKSKDFSHLANRYVKLVVVKKNNPYLFDMFLDKLYKASPFDITIVEDINSFTDTLNEEIINESEDTPTMLDKYVDGLQMDIDPARMKSTLRQIYMEAIALEETHDS